MLFRETIPAMLTREKIGLLMAILAPLVFVALALAGVRLVTMSSAHFADTGANVSSVNLHWPLAFPSMMLIAGLALALVPRRKNTQAINELTVN